MPNAGALTYWYLQLPNLILLALMALLVARLIVSLVVRDGSAMGRFVGRFVGALTQPVIATVGAVTPRIVPPAMVVLCAIVWLVAARIVLFMVALAMGVRL